MLSDKEIVRMHQSGFTGKKEFKVVNEGDGSLAIRFVKKGVDLYFKCRGDKGFKYTKIDRHYLEKGEGITIDKAIEISRAAGAIKNAGGDFLEYIKKATGKKAEDLKQDDNVNKQTGEGALSE